MGNKNILSLRNVNVLLFTVQATLLIAQALMGLGLVNDNPSLTPKSTPPLQETCDGKDMSCPTGQYCFIQSTTGLPKGVCLTPGQRQP